MTVNIFYLIVFVAYFELLRCQADENSQVELPSDDNQQQQFCQFKIDNYQTLEISDDEIIILQISEIFQRDESQYQYSSSQLDFNLEIEEVLTKDHELLKIKGMEIYKTSQNDFWPQILIFGDRDSFVYNKLNNSITQIVHLSSLSHIFFGLLFEDQQFFVAYRPQVFLVLPPGILFPKNESLDFNKGEFLQQIDHHIYSFRNNKIEYQEARFKDVFAISKLIFVINDFDCHHFNNVSYFKSYQNNKLLVLQQHTIGLLTFNDKNFAISCYSFNDKIINVDYEMETERFALVFLSTIKYHIYEIQLDFAIIDQYDTQLFILKSFILFRYKSILQIYTKTLTLVKELTFLKEFQIIGEQDKDGFYLAQALKVIKVSINGKRQIKFNPSIFTDSQQSKNVTLTQQAEEHQCNLKIQFKKYNQNLVRRMINLLNQQNLISFQEQDYELKACKNLNGKRVSKNVINLLSKLKPINLYFRSFRISDKTWIIYLNSNKLLEIYNCDPNCVQKYENIVTFDAAPKVDALQQNSIVYFTLCSQNQCLFLEFPFGSFQIAKEKTFHFTNEINYVAILKDNIYFLDGEQLLKFSLDNFASQPKVMDDFQNVDSIFSSSFKEEYLFIFQKKTLRVFQLIKPLKTLKLIFEFEFTDFFIEITIMAFQDYFVFLGKISNSNVMCQIFNIENDFNIYEQGTINLDYFQTIHFDKIQSVQETNMLYIFGTLYENQQEIVLGYRIGTIIAKSPQFLIKLQQQNLMVVFEPKSISFKLQEGFLLFLIYQDRKQKQNFLSQKSVCYLEIQSIYDILPKLEIEEEIIIKDPQDDDNQIQFPTTFVLTSAIEEMFIYGIYKLYGRKKFRVEENYLV